MSNWDRFVFGSDNHGDQVDKSTVKVFHKFVEDVWKPSIRIHGGDNWDFRALRKGASKEDQEEKLYEDFEAGLDFIEEFRPTHFLRGNHCERLWDLLEKGHGPLADLAGILVETVNDTMAELNCKMLPYNKRDGLLIVGKLKAVHGFGNGGLHAARKLAQVYGSVLSGHFHSIQIASIEGMDNRVARVCGCLCNLDMDYNRAHLGSLMHRHGFVYGVINKKTGEYHCWQAEDINGHWVLPSDIVEIN